MPATKPERANASTAPGARIPAASNPSARMIPTAPGARKLLRREAVDARRQGSSGPTPIKRSRTTASGVTTWSKKGGPTFIRLPVTASDSTGNTVPRNTVNATARNTTLFSRKALSRESAESSVCSLRSPSQRHATSPKAATMLSARNPRKYPPNGDCVKEWTLLSTPLRVRKVPKIDSPNASTTSDTVHC